MGELKARNCKVSIDGTKVNGIGTFTHGGVMYDKVDKTQFGDTRHQFSETLFDGEPFSFDGWFDKTDTAGQTALKTSNRNATHEANLRFYVDTISYHEPDATGVSPASYAVIESYQINAEKAGLVNITFSGKCCGAWALV